MAELEGFGEKDAVLFRRSDHLPCFSRVIGKRLFAQDGAHLS